MQSIPISIPLHIQRRGLPLIDSIDAKSPTGLFSSAIFGVTQEERSVNGAAIALHCYVIRPNVLPVLKRVAREVYLCATSKKPYLFFKDGTLIAKEKIEPNTEIPEGTIEGYGPQFIYDHVWDKMNKSKFEMQEGKFINKKMKQAFKNYTKEQIFTAYQYVPALAYREEPEDGGVVLMDEINIHLADIVRYSRIAANNTMDIENYDLHIMIQKAVEKLYNYLEDRFMGPKGAFRKQFMSRTVVNSARLTLVPNNYLDTVIGEDPVGVNGIGIPLYHTVNLYKDFFLKHCRDFIDYLFQKGCFGDTEVDMLDVYDTQYINNLISHFETPHFRVQPFKAIKNDGTFEPLMVEIDVDINGDGKYTKEIKPLSNIEFLYIVAIEYVRVTETKGVAGTRYPTDSTNSTTMLHVVPTTLSNIYLKSVKLYDLTINKRYPYIDEWLRENYYRNIFEQAARTNQSTVVGWNGKNCPYIQ